MNFDVSRFQKACLATAPLLAVVLLGCGGGEFPTAPVSGVVTLDGEPLANAVVRFTPQRQSESPLVGPASHGMTDSEGRYSVSTHDGERGAVIGPHTVYISTYQTRPVDISKSDNIEIVSEERVPVRYRSGDSKLSFQVPADGTDEADFDLTSS